MNVPSRVETSDEPVNLFAEEKEKESFSVLIPFYTVCEKETRYLHFQTALIRVPFQPRLDTLMPPNANAVA